MGEVQPIHAMGFFVVTRDLGVYQTVIFEYWDSEHYYANLQEDTEALEAELESLAESMQNLLDQEEVVINGERVYPKVLSVSLGFKDVEDEPYLAFFIHFKGKPRKGLNYYENIYEGEVAEYPYEVYWVFPPGSEVKSVEASGVTEILGDNIVVIKVYENERISGYEKIVFTLPR